MCRFKREDGFTLIELLSVLAILGMVIAAVYSFYFTGIRSWEKGLDRMESQQSARIAMDKIVRELRFAYWIDADELQIANNRIIFINKDKYGELQDYLFRLSGEELVFEQISGVTSHTKVALGITGLVFTFDEDKNVRIIIKAGSGPEKAELQTSVRPRNLS